MEALGSTGRFKRIFLQLLEVARGNFSNSIGRSSRTDEMEALVALVNMLTEELRNSFLHQGYVNFVDAYAYVTQLLFILDEKFTVVISNESVNYFLGRSRQEIINRPFINLLSERSRTRWRNIRNSLRKKTFPEDQLVFLSFQTKKGLLFSTICQVIYLGKEAPFDKNIVVTGFELIPLMEAERLKRRKEWRQELLDRRKKTPDSSLQITDIAKLSVVGEYIRGHLKAGLPSLKAIARMVGTNEFKLKKGFKALYGMTVFQFLKRERLKSAHALIEYTDKPFKEISNMIGFKTPSHFSREFKKAISIQPTNFKKNDSSMIRYFHQ